MYGNGSILALPGTQVQFTASIASKPSTLKPSHSKPRAAGAKVPGRLYFAIRYIWCAPCRTPAWQVAQLDALSRGPWAAYARNSVDTPERSGA